MPTQRSYEDACTIARALDVVGERWALLVVRELLFGPQRYTDLRAALPGASSNLVADRLRELDGHGVVLRRKLAPPAASWVYELTEHGRKLEPVLLALGAFGVDVPVPPGAHISATSALLYLRQAARPGRRWPVTVCGIQLDEQPFTVRTAQGRVDVRRGAPQRPVAGLRTTPWGLNE
ncbi:MAG: helix-turn-helix transcriptional regulator, partial [Catenulispora sp.]|nr:helix-turn-helix transcriptional regulator [Catenulispora sp.]